MTAVAHTEEARTAEPPTFPSSRRPTWLLSVVGVAALVASGPALTGWRLLDLIQLVVAGALVPQLCRRASWSAVAFAVLAVAITRSGTLLVLGLALGLLITVAAWRRAQELLALGCTAVLVMVSVGGFHRSSWSTGWWVAAAAVALVVDVATGRRSRGYWQRGVARGAAAAGALLVIVGSVSGIQAAKAATDLRRSLGSAIDAARAGDIEVATAQLDRAGDRCGSIRAGFTGIQGLPLRLLPGIGKHVGDVASYSSTCRRELDFLSMSIDEVRASLTPTDERYDMNALATMPARLAGVRQSLLMLSQDTRVLLAGLPIPHAPASILARLDDIDRAQSRLSTLQPLAAQLPALFGADDERRYFVMFLTPSEGRPLGGFMGNWAMVRADHGLVEIEQSGRTSDISLFNYGSKTLTGLDDLRRRYASYLSWGPNTPIDPDIWSLFTVTPDLPSAGEVARQLAPQSGIGEIDGVISVDIDALTKLMTLTGPVSVPEFGVTLEADSARQMLLVDQYSRFPTRQERVPFLQRIGDELTSRLVDGNLGITRVVSALRSDIDRGGLGVWFVRPEEQLAAEAAKIAPSFPAPEGFDGFVLSTTNRSPNKLDAFLQRTIEYEATVDVATGTITARGSVVLTNTFDPSVHPLHVEAGNSKDDPLGSLREVVCLHTTGAFTDASVPIFDMYYLDWSEACTELLVEAGGSQTFWVATQGEVAAGSLYCFISRGQGTGLPDQFHLVVRTTDGATLIDTHLDGARAKWLVGPGCPTDA